MLDHGADHRHKTLTGVTILHLAGTFADLETVQILRDAHLSDIDIQAKDDVTGLTAMDELLDPQRKFPASEELIESFKLLLAEIEARTKGQVPPADVVVEEDEGTLLAYISSSIPEGSIPLTEDSEEDLVFQDSVEFQIPTKV